jgi:hypothetical protein
MVTAACNCRWEGGEEATRFGRLNTYLKYSLLNETALGSAPP